jgi:PilZ domain
VINDPEFQNGLHQRGKGRDSLFLTASLVVEGKANPVDVRVRNLSSGGMMIDCPSGLVKGQTVVSHLRNIGEVQGHVAWATEGRAGIAFDCEIDPKLPRLPIGTTKHDMPDFLKQPIGRRSGLAIR